MRIIKNHKKIAINRRIGSYSTIGALLILAGGFTISFDRNLLPYSIVTLVIGLVLSQVGTYYTNRFGRSPRPDELLVQALKGLDSSYTLYVFTGPIPFLLVGPAGIWCLQTYTQRGKVIFDNGKWKHQGTNLYTKIFTQDFLGDPCQSAVKAIETTRLHLEHIGIPNIPEIQALLIFVNPGITLETEGSPYCTLQADKIKDFFRRKAKESIRVVSPETIKSIQALLPSE